MQKIWSFVWRFAFFFLSLHRNNLDFEMKKMNLPIGGPSSVEEAIAVIEESERCIEAGQGTSWDAVKEMLAERVYSYAG